MAKGLVKKSWKQRAKSLKSEALVLYFAYRDDRVTWYAKLFIIIVVGYALSPIDLIPDFIPFLGYLDDIILIPLAISIAIKMIPATVMEEARRKATDLKSNPKTWIAAAIIIAIWIALAAWIGLIIYHWVKV